MTASPCKPLATHDRSSGENAIAPLEFVGARHDCISKPVVQSHSWKTSLVRDHVSVTSLFPSARKDFGSTVPALFVHCRNKARCCKSQIWRPPLEEPTASQRPSLEN